MFVFCVTDTSFAFLQYFSNVQDFGWCCLRFVSCATTTVNLNLFHECEWNLFLMKVALLLMMCLLQMWFYKYMSLFESEIKSLLRKYATHILCLQDHVQEFFRKVGIGFVSGTLASCVNIPFDVAKSRIQGPQPVAGVIKYRTTLGSMAIVYREEG